MILPHDDPRLRQAAQPIAGAEIGSAPLRAILKKMSEQLANEPDGVALAAPQIGVNQRLFIVSGKLFAKREKETPPDRIFINPLITKTSRRRQWLEEGCLSIRWLYGLVRRAEKVTVEAYDAGGKKFNLNTSGVLAQIVQHEIDHLDGVLFIDKARDLHEFKPEQNKK